MTKGLGLVLDPDEKIKGLGINGLSYPLQSKGNARPIGPKKMTPDEQELRDRLNIKGLYPDDVISPEGNRVAHPGIFRPDSPIVGTDLANDAEKLYKIAPELRGRAKVVTPAYTSAMINNISKFGSPDLLNDTYPLTILGNTHNDELYVNTRLPNDRMNTLAHEYQHLASDHAADYFDKEKSKMGGLTFDYPNDKAFEMRGLGRDDKFGAYKTGDLADSVFGTGLVGLVKQLQEKLKGTKVSVDKR